MRQYASGPGQTGGMDPTIAELIYHLALDDEWRPTGDSGTPYRRSTLGRSLDEEGFIHCSFGHQVQMIADLVYRGRSDVVLLAIDPQRLGSEVKVEGVEVGHHEFPHIYGSIPSEAVVWTRHLTAGTEGTLMLPDLGG